MTKKQPEQSTGFVILQTIAIMGIMMMGLYVWDWKEDVLFDQAKAEIESQPNCHVGEWHCEVVKEGLIYLNPNSNEKVTITKGTSSLFSYQVKITHYSANGIIEREFPKDDLVNMAVYLSTLLGVSAEELLE